MCVCIGLLMYVCVCAHVHAYMLYIICTIYGCVYRCVFMYVCICMCAVFNSYTKINN